MQRASIADETLLKKEQEERADNTDAVCHLGPGHHRAARAPIETEKVG